MNCGKNLFLVSHIPLTANVSSAIFCQLGYGVLSIISYLKRHGIVYQVINPLNLRRYVRDLRIEICRSGEWDYFAEEAWFRVDTDQYVHAVLEEIAAQEPSRVFLPVYYNFTYGDYINNITLLRAVLPAHAEIVIGGPLATNNRNLFLRKEFEPIRIISNEAEAPVLQLVSGMKAIEKEEFKFPVDVMEESGFYEVTRLHDELINAAGHHKARTYARGPLSTGFMISRGCYSTCSFCCEKTRKMSISPRAEMLRNLEIVLSNRPIPRIGFMDALLPISAQLAEDLGQFRIQYSMQCRADYLLAKEKAKPGFFETLYKSGCVRIGIGVESLNQNELDTLHKQESAEDIVTAMRLITEAGIEVFATCITGIPGQTISSLNRTLNIFMERLNSPLLELIFFPLLVTRGTSLFNDLQRKGFIRDDYICQPSVADYHYVDPEGDFASITRIREVTAAVNDKVRRHMQWYAR